MMSHSSAATPRRRAFVPRTVVAIIALVLIIGGIAWVVQYLPSIKPKQGGGDQPTSEKPLLDFMPKMAIWKADVADPAKKDDDKKALEGFKIFEQNEKGHYDFLFKNISGSDVEILRYESACDCASMSACVLSIDEYDRLLKVFMQEPGKALPYAKDPGWEDLSTDPNKKSSLVVKTNEAGAVRVGWIARKSPGQQLNVSPKVVYRQIGAPAPQKFLLGVPIMVGHAVQFEPARLNVGRISPGDVLTETIDAWSSTRPNLDLKLDTEKLGGETDPFFKITTRPLNKEECAELEETLKTKGITTPKVASAARATIEMRESKDGKQLELGVFYRRLLVRLNGEIDREIRGPEVVGRVLGDITVGGPDDYGRIRFTSFDRKDGGAKKVEIEAPSDVKLEPAGCRPDWVQVKLTVERVQNDGKTIWRLDASVRPKEATRSFEEPDAVVLRIKGAKMERLVRIPIDGQVRTN